MPYLIHFDFGLKFAFKVVALSGFEGETPDQGVRMHGWEHKSFFIPWTPGSMSESLACPASINEFIRTETYQLTIHRSLPALRAGVQFEQEMVHFEIGDVLTAACGLVAARQNRQLDFEEEYRATNESLDRRKKAVDDG